MRLTIQDEEEMHELGKAIAGVLAKGDLVYLVGELGTGKTTLVRGIAMGLGYAGRVNSPTFTIMNIYDTDPLIFHFDFYRLGACDIYDLGLEDYLERDGVSIIEWPQLGKRFLPDEALLINIDLIDNDYEKGRILEIQGRSEKYLQKIEELAGYVGTGC